VSGQLWTFPLELRDAWGLLIMLAASMTALSAALILGPVGSAILRA
jgi:hypothetical protein